MLAILAGAIVVTLAMWHLTRLNGDISYRYAALARIHLAIDLRAPPRAH